MGVLAALAVNIRKLFKYLVIPAILASALVLSTSCQGVRKCKKSARLITKAVKLCPEIAKADTIRDTISVLIDRVQIDTLIAKADTIYIKQERLSVKIITLGDSLRVIAKCDTFYVDVPIAVPVNYIHPVEYHDAPLKWWQTGLMWIGGLLLLVLIGVLIGAARKKILA